MFLQLKNKFLNFIHLMELKDRRPKICLAKDAILELKKTHNLINNYEKFIV